MVSEDQQIKSHIEKSQGYEVFALDAVEGEKLKALEGPKCKTARVDVTSPESIASFKQSLGDQPIDMLLNIAGLQSRHSCRIVQRQR